MTCVYTFGHSSRSIEEFIVTLQTYEITTVVDVRRFPGSRRNPQFGAEALEASLEECGIGYCHLGALGGRRSKPASDSPNDAWENDSFQAYADYALTDEFQTALDDLIALTKTEIPVIVCAETVYWRCHRRIVADWLLARGYDVINIFDEERADEHSLTRFASVSDGRVIYPNDESQHK